MSRLTDKLPEFAHAPTAGAGAMDLPDGFGLVG